MQILTVPYLGNDSSFPLSDISSQYLTSNFTAVTNQPRARYWESESESDLLAAYRQSVCLGVKTLETHDQYFLFQLNTCGYSPYVTSSLTRGVCRLQFLLVLASAVILRSESRGPMTTFYCLRFETPPTWRVRSPYLYLPEIESPPTTRRATVEVLEPPSHETDTEADHIILWHVHWRPEYFHQRWRPLLGYDTVIKRWHDLTEIHRYAAAGKQNVTAVTYARNNRGMDGSGVFCGILICATKIMKEWWRLEFRLCSHLYTTSPGEK
jgi:hypothetical protein